MGLRRVLLGKYQGFGNAPLGPKTLTEQVTDGIARVVDKISGKPADKGGTDLLTEGLPKFRPVTVQSSASVAGRTASLSQQPVTIAAKSQKAARKKGRAGGGWDDDDDEEVEDGNASGTVSDSASIGDSNRTGDITSVPAAQLYEKEVQSVDAFVDPSLEFPPSRQELDEARERCTVLNVDKVVQLLAAKIFAPQQSTQMRALLQDLQPKSSDPVQVKARKISLIIQKLMEEPES
ncbi:hypothetical protein MRX96_018032 [Rhipicephalus microplus]